MTKTNKAVAAGEEADVFGSFPSQPPPRQEAQAEEEIPNPERFMRANFFGTYVVPHPDRLDKKMEKRFRAALVVPKSLLKNNMNFHAYFKQTQMDEFRRRNPDFVRFKSIVFDYATNIDGSEVPDPRTFSIERLQKHCTEQDWKIDFNLYPGFKLREIVFQYFLRIDRVDEREAFYKRQDADRRVHGMSAQVRAELDVVPASHRISFQEI
jgi:hypothetical protein